MLDRFSNDLGGTVRECLDCGCLVFGGPTRCTRCARIAGRRIRSWQQAVWLLVWHTPLCRIKVLRWWSTRLWCEQHADEQ